MEPQTFPITTCLCVAKGDMSFGAKADKTVLDINDSLNVCLAIGNPNPSPTPNPSPNPIPNLNPHPHPHPHPHPIQ